MPPTTNRHNAFISFDYDHDESLKHLLVGQSRYPNSPFDIADFSMKDAAPQRTWREHARRRISLCSVVIVICGQHTHTATGVSEEIRIARELGKPYFLLIGYKDGRFTKPKAALHTDKVYTWTWDNLTALIEGRR